MPVQNTIVVLTGRCVRDGQRAFVRQFFETEGFSVHAESICAPSALSAYADCAAALALCDTDEAAAAADVLRALPFSVCKAMLLPTLGGEHRAIVSGMDLILLGADCARISDASLDALKSALIPVASAAKRNAEALAFGSAHTERPLIGISMFGVTTKGVSRVMERLLQEGFEPVVFHATGSGGDALEAMIRGGLLRGVIDYTPAEISGCLVERSNASHGRLRAAAETGIPELVVPGALDVLIFTEQGGVPEKYNDPRRKFIVHSPTNTCGRTLKDELLRAGEYLVEQVNRGTGPVAVALPLLGLDAFNAPDGPWPELELTNALFDVIRAGLRKGILLLEIPFHINDPQFADRVAEAFFTLFRQPGGKNDV